MKPINLALLISGLISSSCSPKCESPATIFDIGAVAIEFKSNNWVMYDATKLSVIDEKGNSRVLTHLGSTSYSWHFIEPIVNSATDSKDIFYKGIDKTYYFKHVLTNGEVDVDTLTVFLRAEANECLGSELIEENYFYNGRLSSHTKHPFLITFEK